MRRLGFFQVPENLPILKQLLDWAKNLENKVREDLYKKLLKMNLAEQQTEVQAVLKSAKVK